MFARVTQLEIDVMRASVEEAIARFDAEVLPALRGRPGFCGAMVLANPMGFGTIVTLWETEAEARPDEEYEATLQRYVTLFRSPPGRETYEVVLADLPRAPRARADVNELFGIPTGALAVVLVCALGAALGDPRRARAAQPRARPHRGAQRRPAPSPLGADRARA